MAGWCRNRRLQALREGDPGAPVPELVWTPDVTRCCSKRGFDGLVSRLSGRDIV